MFAIYIWTEQYFLHTSTSFKQRFIYVIIEVTSFILFPLVVFDDPTKQTWLEKNRINKTHWFSGPSNNGISNIDKPVKLYSQLFFVCVLHFSSDGDNGHLQCCKLQCSQHLSDFCKWQFKPTKVYFFKLKSKCVNPLPDNFAAQVGHCVFGSIAYTARCWFIKLNT